VTITLSKELESVVNERLKTGAYKNTEELVSAGLRLLEAREKGIDALRAEIMRGVNDIKQGSFTTCTSDADLSELAQTITRDAENESGVLASQ
jgi:putative addiction module CopG family antidote